MNPRMTMRAPELDTLGGGWENRTREVGRRKLGDLVMARWETVVYISVVNGSRVCEL